jgi:hypothetical protein
MPPAQTHFLNLRFKPVGLEDRQLIISCFCERHLRFLLLILAECRGLHDYRNLTACEMRRGTTSLGLLSSMLRVKKLSTRSIPGVRLFLVVAWITKGRGSKDDAESMMAPCGFQTKQ